MKLPPGCASLPGGGGTPHHGTGCGVCWTAPGKEGGGLQVKARGQRRAWKDKWPLKRVSCHPSPTVNQLRNPAEGLIQNQKASLQSVLSFLENIENIRILKTPKLIRLRHNVADGDDLIATTMAFTTLPEHVMPCDTSHFGPVGIELQKHAVGG